MRRYLRYVPVLFSWTLRLSRGPVAQLGARFHGMEEVKGSNPFRSTNFPLLDSSQLYVSNQVILAFLNDEMRALAGGANILA